MGLGPKNAELRKKIRKAFVWYDEVNDEADQGCCFLAIRLTKGTLNINHWEKLYHFDFENKRMIDQNDTFNHQQCIDSIDQSSGLALFR